MSHIMRLTNYFIVGNIVGKFQIFLHPINKKNYKFLKKKKKRKSFTVF